MSRRRAASRPRRSPTEWAVRGALAVVAAGLGTVSVAHSLAYMIRGSDPERAHALAPWDGRITALLSEKLSAPGADAADRRQADKMARLALYQDPVAVPAVATLGINAQVRGDTAGARRLFAYSEKLSRRDLRTQLWAIEDAVAHNDIPGVLHSYDIALRTSRIAPDLLFPVLASAISEPDIRQSLVATLSKQPAWTSQFTGYVAGHGPDARNTASLFQALARHNIAPPPWGPGLLINRLLTEGHAVEAWQYYATITPGAERNRSRNPRFAAAPSNPTPFDWAPMNDNGVSASLQSNGDRNGLFDFAVPAGAGGPVLRQMQMLLPGRYRLTGVSQGITATGSAAPYWSLDCTDGRPLGKVLLPQSSQDNGRFAGEFVLNTGCLIQYLTFFVPDNTDMNGTSGQILQIQLSPL